MDATGDDHSKWSQKEEDKCHVLSLTCEIWNTTQTSIESVRLRLWDQTSVAEGEVGMGDGEVTFTTRAKGGACNFNFKMLSITFD